jgi:two-component system response regulator FixJ
VDDDPAVRLSTIALLEQAGHRVYAFESGTALVEGGVPKDVDIILLDIMMPGLNGLETLRILSADTALPPVVMMTGHGDIQLAVEAMKLGAVEFLEKPYPIQALRDLISSLEKSTPASANNERLRADAIEKIERLTARQREVLKGLALGEQGKETAYRLSLSARTIEAYRGQLFIRLGVRGMAEAIRIAVLGGLLER